MLCYMVIGSLHHTRYCDYLFTKVLGMTKELFNIRSGSMSMPHALSEKYKKQQKKSKEKANAQANLVRAQKHAAEVVCHKDCFCPSINQAALQDRWN